MKPILAVALILFSGLAGFAFGWLLCALCADSQHMEQCAACHLTRTVRER